MKKLLSAVLAAGIMIFSVGFYAFAAEPYDFRTDLPSGAEAESLSEKTDQLLFSVGILAQRDPSELALDYADASKCFLLDMGSLENHLADGSLVAAVLSSVRYSYVVPICDSDSCYYIGMMERSGTGELYPQGMEIPKSGTNLYDFIYHPEELEKQLSDNDLSDPDFIAPIVLTDSSSVFLYVIKGEKEALLPYSSESGFPLTSGSVYTKSEVLAYLDSIKQPVPDGDMLGGGYSVQDPSSQWTVWGIIIVITLIFIVAGTVWLKAYQKKAARGEKG